MDASNNSPEQRPPENSRQQAREAAEQIVAEIQMKYADRFEAIAKETDDAQRIRMRDQLAQEMKNDWKTRVQQQTEETGRAREITPQDEVKKSTEAKRIFLEVDEMKKNNIEILDPKSQLLVDGIVRKIKDGDISDRSAIVIEQAIGRQLIDGVVVGGEGQQLSDFDQGIKILKENYPETADPLIKIMKDNPGTFGTTEEAIINKYETPVPMDNLTPEQRQMLEEQGRDARFGPDGNYYQTRFTDTQKDLISTFYSPEKFVNYMEELSTGETADGKFKDPKRIQEVRNEKQEIADNIRRYYEKKNEPLSPEKLQAEVDKQWGEKMSDEMNWRVSDVINQLFLELQQKAPDKFYEEIMQEDIFQGPSQIQHRIQSAVNGLMTKIDQIQGNESDPLHQRVKNLKFYRPTSHDPFIAERNKKLYPRVDPIPFGKEVPLSEFIQYINSTIDQTIHKAEYFHNARAMFNHPPGEKGFYAQLGGYAEKMKGTDIDEIMHLPDGQYVLQAYQLYEKMLEEDFASIDWRHRPDQLTNKFERVNSKIETEVFDQLKDFYPDLTIERVRNIVNSAVGVARGVFLTEPEKAAYADPVDADGKGMVASYSTNDAGSLNVFNPLHTVLRWQGEHNWNSMYFMPVEGQQGKMWDHNSAWNNMAKYMDSFLVGKGRGTGKDKLPQETFADSMIDIGKVGGPGKRKGWRMKYSLEGHFKYDDDGSINAPETFKAMEAIGYEAIYNFIANKQAGEGLMKASDKTAPGQVKERNELFKYIYQRYFSEDPSKFQESDFNKYWTKLKGKGEESLIEKIKKTGTSVISGSWEEQVNYETSLLFMDNTLAHYVASRFPSKFLRMDRNRFADDGVGRWERIYRELNKDEKWERKEFDVVMKNMTMAEMLLRRKISEEIRQRITLDENLTLSEIKDLPFRLNEESIRELLSTNMSKNKNNNSFKSQKEIEDVIKLWRHIQKDFNNNNFLDGEGADKIRKYTFTFGLEDTDVSLMAFRATGPRMVARAVKDVGAIESTITNWVINMPLVLNEIAINGKHDFSPIIEYMRKAQRAITDVNGVEDTYEHMYKIAGTVINYFKKDAIAKPLFGIFGVGRKNSIAAEYAGRSGAVWEWDSRDIDRFCVSLESFGLLKNSPYDLQSFKDGKFTGGTLEDRWIKIPGIKKPIKFNLFGKKRHVDYKYNSLKLRKDHGADFKAIALDWINQLLPIALAFILWKYMKDAIDEASGAKKK